jgi:hypothetical protein
MHKKASVKQEQKPATKPTVKRTSRPKTVKKNA